MLDKVYDNPQRNIELFKIICYVCKNAWGTNLINLFILFTCILYAFVQKTIQRDPNNVHSAR